MSRLLLSIDEARAHAPLPVTSPSEPRAASRFLRPVVTALAILVVAAAPCAHAQTATSTTESGTIVTARVAGSAGIGTPVAVNAPLTATAATTQGGAAMDDMTLGARQPKADPTSELTTFHPLTDF